MIKKTLVLFIICFLAFFNNGLINFVSDANFLEVAEEEAAGPSFLPIDANTVQGWAGGMGGTTSESGTSDGNTAWTLTGTDSTTASVSVTMGDTTIEGTTRNFSGSNNYLTNNTSSLITGTLGDYTIEAIVKPDDLSHDNARVWGSLNNDGIQTMIMSDGGFDHYEDEGGSGGFVAQIGGSMGTSSFTHIVVSVHQTAVSGVKCRVAYKTDGIITDLTGTGGAGQPDVMGTSATIESTHTDPDGWWIGNGNNGVLGSSNSGFDGQMFEFRISNIGRYY